MGRHTIIESRDVSRLRLRVSGADLTGLICKAKGSASTAT